MNAPSSISLFATFELATARRAIFAYTVIILVLSSPILMPTNPQLIAASAGPIHQVEWPIQAVIILLYPYHLVLLIQHYLLLPKLEHLLRYHHYQRQIKQ